MSTLAWIVASGVLMSGVALVGSVTLVLPEATCGRLVLSLVALAAGSLLGGALFHMLPESVDEIGNGLAVYGWLAAGWRRPRRLRARRLPGRRLPGPVRRRQLPLHRRRRPAPRAHHLPRLRQSPAAHPHLGVGARPRPAVCHRAHRVRQTTNTVRLAQKTGPPRAAFGSCRSGPSALSRTGVVGHGGDVSVRVTDLVEETPWRWRLDPTDGMRVPGVVFASRDLLPTLVEDRSLDQVANVAALPGIVGASYAMPDVHWGYGFPIGGVAATDVDAGGVVSPGGVGFDICCGVRLLRSEVSRDQLEPARARLMDELARLVPKGMRRGAVWELGSEGELRRVLARGALEAVERGFGNEQDLARCEDRGVLAGADPNAISQRALARGLHQVGSLGSGNHFLELQAVDTVTDDGAAAVLGLREGQVCVMIHSGSRGLGHQVCSDHVRRMESAMARYRIAVPDRQLACVPVRSPDGEAYLAAMAAAANYGRANRHLLAVAARRAFAATVGTDRLELVYDVSHNLAKLEHHDVDGTRRLLCVHRKGATRALPPHHPDLPADLADVGQPVLVPGSMGTASHVLVGAADGGAFHSSCHGAGRTMSRTKARQRVSGQALRYQLEVAGVAVRAASNRGLAEEAPFSYKDVDQVVATVERAGLARRVARLVPLGVVKG